jgi:transcriptional regulator with XRE-family HTH domain
MTRRNLSQRDVSDLLGGVSGGWSQSRVAKILTGRVELGVDEAAALAFALDLSLVEVVRDPGLEFCAEMQPSELRLLDKIRQLPPATWEALMTLLQIQQRSAPNRYAKKPKPIFPPLRPRPKARKELE